MGVIFLYSVTIIINIWGMMKKTFALIGFGLLVSAAPVMAQSNDVSQLNARIAQLENQIQTLSRAVFRGDVPPPQFDGPATGNNASAVATLEVRLSQLENQIQELTGQIEEQQYQINQLNRQAIAVEAPPLRPVSPTNEVTPTYTAPTEPDTMPVTTTTPAPAANVSAASFAGLSPDELYEKSFVDIRDGRYDTAEAGFKTFLEQYPDHTLASNAQYWLAETYYVRADYTESAKLFANGYQQYPDSPKAADNLLKLGLSLGKLGKTEDACLSFEQVKTQFPDETGPVMRRTEQEMKNLNCE